MAALSTLKMALVHGILMHAAPASAFFLSFAEHSARASVSALRMDAEADFGLADGQKYGPTAPAHPAEKPWTNLNSQEGVQLVKAASKQLRAPLDADLENDEIYVSKDSIHILKHHGSYMQQNRDLKKKVERDQSYQFMLRLKMPCGEVPGPLFRELDDLSNKYGQGDMRATTRQAFQLHGVMKANLKTVISTIANVGSHTYGGCGDINRNVMVPAVHFPNNPAYVNAQKYAKAISDLFKPMSSAFNELWLNGEKAATVEYWQNDIAEFNLDELRTQDNGNGIITGHPVEVHRVYPVSPNPCSSDSVAIFLLHCPSLRSLPRLLPTSIHPYTPLRSAREPILSCLPRVPEIMLMSALPPTASRSMAAPTCPRSTKSPLLCPVITPSISTLMTSAVLSSWSPMARRSRASILLSAAAWGARTARSRPSHARLTTWVLWPRKTSLSA